MPATIKAMHINPRLKQVTEITLPLDAEGFPDGAALRAIIFPESPDGGLLELCRLGAGVIGVIDEEGALHDWDEQSFFCMGVGDGAPHFAGHMVLIKEVRGGRCVSLPFDAEYVTDLVRWLTPQQARFPGAEMTFMEGGKVRTEKLSDDMTYASMKGGN